MSRLLAAAVAVAALLTAALVAVPSPAGAIPPGRPTRVLILGDSVMAGGVNQFHAVLPGREVVVDAEVNRTTGQGSDVLARVGTDWDVVVVLLGHNDGSSPGVYQPAARHLLDQLRAVPRVTWLTLHEVRDDYPPVNQFIKGLQFEYPNLRTADWNAVARAHPEGVAGDGLHLNGTGADLMAHLAWGEVFGEELEFIDGLRRLNAAAQATSTTTTAPPTTTTTAAPPTSTTKAATTTSTTEAATTEATAPPTTAASAGGSGDQDSDAATTIGLAAGAIVVGVFGVVSLLVRRRRREQAADPDGTSH